MRLSPLLRSLLCFLALTLMLSGTFLSTVPQTKALTVSPVKLELAGDPGQTVGGIFKLYNEEKEEKTFYISYASADARGESGTPQFVEADEGLPLN